MINKTLILSIISIVFFCVACGGKSAPQHMNVGVTLMENAVDYALQGQKRMADFTYNKAIEKFRDMGRYCDMARVAIIMDSVSNNIGLDTINDAKSFSILGACKSELNIVSFLQGTDFDLNTLEEPYKAYALSEQKDSISPLESVASSLGDRGKSETYRMIANMLIKKNKAEEALPYIEKARSIDSEHAWSSNLLDDEITLRSAYEQLKRPTDIITERINIIKKVIDEKF